MFIDYIVPLIHRSRFHIVKEDIHPYKRTMIMYILYLECDEFTIALE
jgi:hypothetical protein